MLAGLQPVGPGVCEVRRWPAGMGGEPEGKPVHALAAVGVKSRVTTPPDVMDGAPKRVCSRILDHD